MPDYYQADPITGRFVGPVTVETVFAPSGRFVEMVPEGAVAVAPPDVPAGFASRWTGAAWEVVTDGGEQVIAEDPAAPTLDELVDAELAALELSIAGDASWGTLSLLQPGLTKDQWRAHMRTQIEARLAAE